MLLAAACNALKAYRGVPANAKLLRCTTLRGALPDAPLSTISDRPSHAEQQQGGDLSGQPGDGSRLPEALGSVTGEPTNEEDPEVIGRKARAVRNWMENQVGKDRMELAQILKEHQVLVRGSAENAQLLITALLAWKEQGPKG